jgi:WD40 repeat protein
MMLLVIGVPQCFTVLTEVGKLDKLDFGKGIISLSSMFILLKYLVIPSNVFSLSFPRLFSCGTSKDGESFLVEWNESEGAIKRTYNGFRKKSAGVVQFDTTQNRFLVAGEDGQVKFWDMDNINLITSTDADGGLQVSILWLTVVFGE